MANICSNMMCIYAPDGNTQKLRDFYNKLHKLYEEDDDLNVIGIAIQLRPDLDKNKIFKMANDNYWASVGWIDDIEYREPNINIDTAHIFINYQSKWCPCIELWNLAIEPSGLKQVTIAEEPGCHVYINTDTECKFFNDKYCIDVSGYFTVNGEKKFLEYHEYYYDSENLEEHIIADINEVLGEDLGVKFNTIDEIKTFMDKADDEVEDGWAIFEKFIPDYTSENKDDLDDEEED